MIHTLEQLIAFVNTHGVLCVTAASLAQFVFGSIVDSLPEPMPNGSQGYAFAYRFAHKLAANWSRSK